MEQIVQVLQAFPDGTAQVLQIRDSTCSGDCRQCGGCAAPQQNQLNVRNPIDAKPGDRVVLKTEAVPVLKVAMMLYLLPLALLIAGFLAGEWLWSNGILPGLAGMLLGFAAVRAYDRHLTRKNTTYTITGYAPEE